MEIILPPDLEDIVNEKVESGEFESATEVIHEALRRLDQRDRERERKLEDMRREVAVGLEQLARGEYRSYDSIDEFIEDVEADVARILAERESRSRVVA